MNLKNQRPNNRPNKKTMTLEQRKKISIVGCQWSETMGTYLPWVFDGITTVNLEPKTTRDKALAAARQYHHNVFNPEVALEVWTPDAHEPV